MEDDFKEDHDITVGVEFGSFMVKVEDKILKLQVWDTAGQESFRSITKIFYRGAHVVILAYSIINGVSFESLSEWLREVRTQCSPDVMLCIVGNKSDLEYMREVTVESVLEFKEMNNIMYYCETSAKQGKNVETLFTDCARFIYSKYKDRMDGMAGGDGDLSSENDSMNNSFTSDRERNSSFKESGGHKATRLNSRKRKLKKNKKQKNGGKCGC
jgi:Ras-related protein Rab-2A